MTLNEAITEVSTYSTERTDARDYEAIGSHPFVAKMAEVTHISIPEAVAIFAEGLETGILLAGKGVK
jgi:hypothetical protein